MYVLRIIERWFTEPLLSCQNDKFRFIGMNDRALSQKLIEYHIKFQFYRR